MLPTNALYTSLLQAYKHFNESLFGDELPNVIFTVQRKKGMLGYFAPERWSSLEGKHCHEIAINPTHMGTSRIIDVLQTLVHEMVHCWQYCLGNPPTNSCYHNKEWAYKMIEIGLQPSSTAMPGGDIVGQHMSDYPIEHGTFLKASIVLLESENFKIPWIDRLSTSTNTRDLNANDTGIEHQSNNTTGAIGSPMAMDSNQTAQISQALPDSTRKLFEMTYEQMLPEETFIKPPRRNSSKTKYQCPSCFNNVWGKDELNIICGNCGVSFEEQG